jgi:hypothetical protein
MKRGRWISSAALAMATFVVSELAMSADAASPAPRTTNATGRCPDGAPVTVAQGTYAGNAMDALREPTLAQLHKAHTQSFGQDWLTHPTQSGANRTVRVRERDGREQDVLVLTICGSADCNVRAYEAFDPRTKDWGASIYNGGPVVELGHPVMPGAAEETLSLALSGPIICTQDLDWGRK